MKHRIGGWIFLGALVIFLLFDMTLTYRSAWENWMPLGCVIDLSNVEPEGGILLSDENTVAWDFEGTKEGLGSGTILMEDGERDFFGVIHVKITDESNGAVLYEDDFTRENISDVLSMNFEDGIRGVSCHPLIIELSTTGISEEDGIYLQTVNDEVMPGSTCTINGEKMGCDLALVLFPAAPHAKRIKLVYVFLAYLLITSVIYAFVMLKRQNVNLGRDVFLPISMVIGIAYMLFLPPFAAPDEETHFVTAYNMSNHILGVYDEDNIWRCREEDKYYTYSDQVNSYTYFYMFDDMFRRTTATENTAENPVWGDMFKGPITMNGPGALGITFARILKLGYTDMILWGRFFNLLISSICIAGAISLTPVRKELFFVLGCLPIAFQQRASFSYDGMNIGLIFLFTAYLLHLIYEKDRIEKKDYVFLLLGMFFAAPMKLVYFPVALLVLLIPNAKFSNARAWMIKTGYALSAVVFTVLWNSSRFIKNWDMTNETDYDGYTLSGVLTDFPHTCSLLIETIREKLGFYVNTTFGVSLGYFRFDFGNEFLIVLVIALVLALLIKQKYEVKTSHRWMFAIVFLLSAGMSVLTMLLVNTPLESPVIEGVQGRYFLPVLPLLLLCLPEVRIEEESERLCSKASMILIVFVNAWMVTRLFGMVMAV